MKLRRDAKTLKLKSLCSLRRGLSAFNSYEEDGRITAILLHLQHTCEMLIKAALLQKGANIFDKKSGRSLSFEKCINLARQNCGLSESSAGTMRAIDSLRDAEQHWIVVVEEDILYLHARALVTAVDEVLKSVFNDDLSSHLPTRVLPVSLIPPQKIDYLLDREYKKIGGLLTPGRRARDEARGRIRALLAMESHAVDEVAVSEKDINRIERAIKSGKGAGTVFPRLVTINTEITGVGINVTVHFTKKKGAPVKFVSGDDTEEAGAIREIDLQKKYHLQRKELAKTVGLTTPKAAMLRSHLKIDGDRGCSHTFEFGSQRIFCYSDNAVRKIEDWLGKNNIEDLWRESRNK